MKKWAVILVVALGAALAMAVRADPGKMDRARGPDTFRGAPRGRSICHPAWAERAGLSEEDKQALETLFYEHEKGIIPLRANSQLAQLELRRLLEQEKPDEAAVMKAVETAGQAEIALEKARVAHQIRVRSVLGPEKTAQLREMRHERRGERRKEQRDRRGGRGERAEHRGRQGSDRGPWGRFAGGFDGQGPEGEEPPPEE